MSLASRLDAADGVMDGRYFGRPIVEVGQRYRTSTATALDAADGVLDGRYFGRPIIETSSYAPALRTVSPIRRVASPVRRCASPVRTACAGPCSGAVTRSAYAAPYRTSTALTLDAADGVLDGRYYGRPIVETTGTQVVSGAVPYRSSTALALDAADGVLDGRYYGRPIVETTGYPTRRYAPVTSGVAPAYRSSAAVALDAADGVLDGRYYGRPIVETSSIPARRYLPAESYVGAVPAYRSSAALAVDAADGVIDGTFYGRPIVETSRYGSGYGSVTRYGGNACCSAPAYRTSTAVALDAADGVLDGRYYGRPIVETAPSYRVV